MDNEEDIFLRFRASLPLKKYHKSGDDDDEGGRGRAEVNKVVLLSSEKKTVEVIIKAWNFMASEERSESSETGRSKSENKKIAEF